MNPKLTKIIFFSSSTQSAKPFYWEFVCLARYVPTVIGLGENITEIQLFGIDLKTKFYDKIKVSFGRYPIFPL